MSLPVDFLVIFCCCLRTIHDVIVVFFNYWDLTCNLACDWSQNIMCSVYTCLLCLFFTFICGMSLFMCVSLCVCTFICLSFYAMLCYAMLYYTMLLFSYIQRLISGVYLSLNQVNTDSANLASQVALREFCFHLLGIIGWSLSLLSFHVGSEDPNYAHHVCTANMLSTETSLLAEFSCPDYLLPSNHHGELWLINARPITQICYYLFLTI